MRRRCRLPKKLAGVSLLEAINSNGGPLPCPPEPRLSLGHGGSSTTVAAALTIGGVVVFSATCVVLFLFWRRNKIRNAYRAKQQIRYRRAVMEEEAVGDDTAHVVST